MNNLVKKLGIVRENGAPISKQYLHQYIDLRLISLGLSDIETDGSGSFLDIAKNLLETYRERERIIRPALCPSDRRIQDFIDDYFLGVENCPPLQLPNSTFTLDFHGLARELSLPPDADEYASEYLKSYRIKQGILHNPKNDRRTTKGVFHVAEGGLPVPDDKKAVPKHTAAYLLHRALAESGDILNIPYTASQDKPAKAWISLLLRPIVCPEVSGITPERTMEIRFFAPASLVSNMDFVESIFGNAGNPYSIQNDAALDIEHWTGHTGCVILAPQLTGITKKEAGLPHVSEATERQKRDGMCWENEDEYYNDGSAFKITFRTDDGIIVTVIADNYFGYSKKEVKTQINFAANLFGNCEEEHAGGAMVFPTYNQGDQHINKPHHIVNTFDEMSRCFADIMDIMPEGYAIDRNYKNIFYVPENTAFHLATQKVSWQSGGEERSIKLLPDNYYILPNGSKFSMDKVPGSKNYRLIETVAEGTLFHKPCTVSGGGKSEISKSISDAIFTGSFFIKDYHRDMEYTRNIIEHDYGKRYRDDTKNAENSRPFLSPRRSNGSVIKLLTPSPDFTDEYNAWLDSIPQYIKGIAFIVKRYYREEWGDNWHEHFTVDILNGQLGNELKYDGRKLASRYLRVGFDEQGAWRTFKLRQDFVHAAKLQMEDDITASIVVPARALEKLNPLAESYPSVKIITNCEYRFFQRPDEAIHRGYDKKAEADLASPNTFVSNYEPLTKEDAQNMLDETVAFESFTEPMRNVIREMASGNGSDKYFISSANPRIVNGKPSANVRYLQTRNDLIAPIENYVAEVGMRLSRKIPTNEPLFTPVNLILPGRRNNPREKGIRPLAVYNPVHYQELPELFMDFICSLTGKSPSTTGAGSEGALTKIPFNALSPIIDLNNALVSYILTGYPGFTTPAGYIGSKFRVDHDLSLLIPELWARLYPAERNPQNMIADGYLEKINDFEHGGQQVKASILGYRITSKFVNMYFGRIFENPNVVLTEEMLKPELQDMSEFVDGINNIVEAQNKIAMAYFNDGSVEQALLPLKALLHIMAHGHYEGMTLESPELRNMFTYDYLINSDAYANRLMLKQQQDIKLWEMHARNLTKKLNNATAFEKEIRSELTTKINYAREMLESICSYPYLKNLQGQLGRDAIKKN